MTESFCWCRLILFEYYGLVYYICFSLITEVLEHLNHSSVKTLKICRRTTFLYSVFPVARPVVLIKWECSVKACLEVLRLMGSEWQALVCVLHAELSPLLSSDACPWDILLTPPFSHSQYSPSSFSGLLKSGSDIRLPLCCLSGPVPKVLQINLSTNWASALSASISLAAIRSSSPVFSPASDKCHHEKTPYIYNVGLVLALKILVKYCSIFPH